MDSLKFISDVFNSLERVCGVYDVTGFKYNILCKYMNKLSNIQKINIVISSDWILPEIHIDEDFVRDSIREDEMIFVNIQITSDMHNGVHSIGMVWFPTSDRFELMETNHDIDYSELWGTDRSDINKIIAAELYKILCIVERNPKMPKGVNIGMTGKCINITANNLGICVCHANNLLIFSMIKSGYATSPTSAFDKLSRLDCKRRSFIMTYFVCAVVTLVVDNDTHSKHNISRDDRDLGLYSCGITHVHNYSVHEYYDRMSEFEKEEHEKMRKKNDYYRQYFLKSNKQIHIEELFPMLGYNDEELKDSCDLFQCL